jgi:ribosomal protein L14
LSEQEKNEKKRPVLHYRFDENACVILNSKEEKNLKEHEFLTDRKRS